MTWPLSHSDLYLHSATLVHQVHPSNLTCSRAPGSRVNGFLSLFFGRVSEANDKEGSREGQGADGPSLCPSGYTLSQLLPLHLAEL